MILGVIIGIVLLLLLVGLVVLQGLIEWGGVDTDKWFGGEKSKDSAPAKEDKKEVSKPLTKAKTVKKTIAKKAKKKGVKK